MNFIRLENAAFVAKIALHGAELKMLQSKNSGRNYIYDGTGSWKRSSPVLFPNIGGLAEEVYLCDGKEYPAPAHGFARDMDFALVEESGTKAVLSLESNEKTKVYFPFDFELRIIYTLTETGICITWQVENKDTRTMYFSIGAHPGFQLLPKTGLSDYVLQFDVVTKIETRRVVGRYLTQDKEPLVDACDVFPLSPSKMEKDAIILEDTGISKITLIAPRYDYHLWIEFPDFPVVAVWTDPHAVKSAQFICLEPWCGINDFCEDSKKEISLKNRVTALEGKKIFERSYTIGVQE